uniref:Aldehyde-alcohol dehydrogenase n=1 Tax=Chromera velia CCMP2878 TaxID=1169474 RepID=A0A0G4FHH1_9ALVE|mmetsp:Transcript_39773/g.78396  ORF Transcript_39773/g.78396 Transcript_39773/m.78396 type:complete len:870 (+) Transcript_39773:229-2838(+)|eukprot:Cvel_16873.t1-p1 / transcript=Cvel_16873.t1 / gene=Cvel_16873 / organism=Chromera_velia_CCMP2878 / gene_product=Aldehyde-alcohol dehydrogenase, putative / transcript_product=Aldehyde-alcohol dehydrogenase, putative / location=Cvel_scaffold1320:10722-17532(+) / protein_length=869 / sequence_SO=supercontig / SO=protein_coding / is_pseudo=false
MATTMNPEQEIDELVNKTASAQKKYASFTQEQVDVIFRMAASAAAAARIPLAKMAAQETGMGVMEDKVIKNQFASEYIYNTYKDTQTCGVVEDDRSFGFMRVAEPVGLVAGVTPTTNPTSTAIFKSLLALKTRNGIIFCPHPRAKKCTAEACRIVHDAAVKAGAPEGIVTCVTTPSAALSAALMRHPKINLILATGGPGMVRAAYSSGKPAIGVGAGNTPVLIDETADLKMAISSVLISKTFDNGMICASEQSIVVCSEVYDEAVREFEARGAVFVKGDAKAKLAELVIIDDHLNAAIVGQPATKIAEMAGITDCPPYAKVLIAEVEEVGPNEPLSFEKLSPVLGMYKARDFQHALEISKALVAFGGSGHTSVLYTDPARSDRVAVFHDLMTAGRILINMPASQGAIGDVFNFRLPPSLTLGCGSWGGNSVSENIGVKHLLNYKSVAERRENMLWFRVPPRVYFKQGALRLGLEEMAGSKTRAVIITDKAMVELGFVKKVQHVLDSLDIKNRTWSDVKPDPDIQDIKRALDYIHDFEPDLFVAVGGGSPIDASKLIWLMYEQPTLRFQDIALRFMDIRKRIIKIPDLGQKATLVAIPTTSGTGSEVTPFTVITDNETHCKYPLADYALTPNMAIVDPELVMTMPKSLCAWSGIDALTHALECYVSVLATHFTDGHCIHAMELIFKYLERSYKQGAKDPEARENMHYAATIAGMAFANGFLGVCHSMAHQLGGSLRIPHGLANAMLLPYVIRYNATDMPTKQGLMPQYKYPDALHRYAEVVDTLKLGPSNLRSDQEKVDVLIEAVQNLKRVCHVPLSIKDWGIEEDAFYGALDTMVERAFDDQCTGANPRYPLLPEIRELYEKAYRGDTP